MGASRSPVETVAVIIFTVMNESRIAATVRPSLIKLNLQLRRSPNSALMTTNRSMTKVRIANTRLIIPAISVIFIKQTPS